MVCHLQLCSVSQTMSLLAGSSVLVPQHLVSACGSGSVMQALVAELCRVLTAMGWMHLRRRGGVDDKQVGGGLGVAAQPLHHEPLPHLRSDRLMRLRTIPMPSESASAGGDSVGALFKTLT
jgi:hypothetical protein